MTTYKSFEEVVEKHSKDEEIHHEILWWITRKMTLEEWQELDDKMSQVLYDIVGDDFAGYAGPIP